MERRVLFDKLSEFLMVEQGGLELYRIAMSRASKPELRQRYDEFAKQTDHHRTVLVRLIERLGGDPNYVSPTACLAQVKAASLLEATIRADGLSLEEIEVNDLENVVLAETKDNSDWDILEQLTQQVDDADVKQALEEAVKEVGPEEDEHLAWALHTMSQMALQVLLQGPVPSPTRWEQVISGPMPPIQQGHPAPIPRDAGLLQFSQEPAWQETMTVRQSHAV